VPPKSGCQAAGLIGLPGRPHCAMAPGTRVRARTAALIHFQYFAVIDSSTSAERPIEENLAAVVRGRNGAKVKAEVKFW
jgi:hypothetical protein